MRRMRKAIVVPLFLILPAGCGFVEFEPCPGPTSEEIETCAKIAADWRSRVERFDAEDWHNVQECFIRYDNDRKPTELRIRVASSLELEMEQAESTVDGTDFELELVPRGQCSALVSALEISAKSVIGAPVSVDATVSTSRVTCAKFRVGDRRLVEIRRSAYDG